MRFSTKDEWLHWIESCHPSEIELGLERIGQVAKKMSLNFDDSHVITVAGTNGKGSCVAVLDHLLRRAGLSVGCYTSPHLLRYNERIRLNGDEVDDQTLIAAFAKVDQLRGETPLTYFEYGTLAALDIFATEQMDVIVLEVGLGGRLDASNVIDADIAIVTSIALDHADWLGSDLNVIAREKSGIFRANKIALCGDPNRPPAVEETARLLGARFYQRDKDFGIQVQGQLFNWQGIDSHSSHKTLEQLALPHLPIDSVAVAIQACQLLSVNISDSVFDDLNDITLAGRFQKITLANKALIVDVAHNPAAAMFLAKRLQGDRIAGKTYALFGVMADKDVQGIVAAMASCVDHWFLVGLGALPRAMHVTSLSELMEQNCFINTSVFTAVSDGLTAALSVMTDQDRLIVFGSFHTVAGVLSVLENQSVIQ